MFNLISKAVGTVVDVATLPLSAVADAVTLMGAINDRPEPYTVTNIKHIVGDIESLAGRGDDIGV